MKEFLDSLLSLLDDPDEAIVAHTLVALRHHPGADVARRVESRLASVSDRNVAAGVTTLGALSRGDEATLVTRLIGHPSPRVRFEAARQLGTHLPPAAAPLLAGALAREQDPHARATFLALCTRGRYPVPTEVLLPLLADADARVRANAVGALWTLHGEKIEAALAALIDDPVPRVRAAVWQALFPSRAADLTSRIQGELASHEEDRIMAALYLIGQLPATDWAAPELVKHLAHASARVRLMAARSAEHLGVHLDPTSLVSLYLAEPAREVRTQLMTLLLLADRTTVHSELTAALASARDPRRQASAARGLGELKDARSIRPLRSALSSPDARVRANVVEALARCPDPELEHVLEAALEDPSPRVVANASVALHRRCQRDVTGPLLRLLSSRDALAQSCAAFALGEIGGRAYEAPLTKVLDRLGESIVQTQATRALQRHVVLALKKIRSP